MSLIVLKGGGSVVAETASATRSWSTRGHRVVVIHGAGSHISAEMRRLGIEVRFVGGRRVTGREALDVVRHSLAEVNRELCEAIGSSAVGLMGDDIGLVAEPIPELGFVGRAVPSRPRLVVAALRGGKIPVVAPLAAGPLNVNADEAAAALAVGLGADHLHFVADVPGVLVGNSLAGTIRAEEVVRQLEAGEFQGGIVPKLQAAALAAQAGLQVRIGATEVLAQSRPR